jgi:hypothetical protein
MAEDCVMDTITVVIIRRLVAAATYHARIEGREVCFWPAAEVRLRHAG